MDLLDPIAPRPKKEPPRAAKAMVGAHLALVAVAVAWLLIHAGTAEPPPATGPVPNPSLPWWIVGVWVAGFLALGFAPWQPIVGLVVYLVFGYLVPRYEPGLELPLNLLVLNVACGLGATGAVAWMGREGTRPRMPRQVLTWVMLAFVGWAAVCSIVALLRGGPWSPEPQHSPLLFAQALVLFLLASTTTRGPMAAWILSMALCGAIAARAVSLFLAKDSGVFREEDIAAICVIALPLAALGAISWPSRGSPMDRPMWVGNVALFAGTALVMFKVLYGAQNRGSLIALGVVVLAMAVASRHKLLWLLIGGPVVAVAGSLVLATPRMRELVTQGTQTDTAQSRLALWRAGGRMIAANPIFGVGPGNFEAFVRDYSPGVPLGNAASAHNNFIAIAAEMGWFGLVLYVALFVTAAWALLRVSWLAQRDPPGPAARAVFPALAGYLAIGCFITRHDWGIAYLLAGWAAGMYGQMFGDDVGVRSA